MITDEHYRKLERMHLSSPFHQHHFPSLSIYVIEERAEVSLTLDSTYRNTVKALHANIYTKVLEDAAFLAAHSIINDQLLIPTAFHSDFLKPVSKGILRAIGVVKFKSRTVFIAESKLFNSYGNEIAMATGNYMKSNIKLGPEIGYQ